MSPEKEDDVFDDYVEDFEDEKPKQKQSITP